MLCAYLHARGEMCVCVVLICARALCVSVSVDMSLTICGGVGRVFLLVYVLRAC